MGIRVHKVIGYGVTNLKKSDPRINWDLFNRMWERDCAFEKFVEWVIEHQKEVIEVALNEMQGIEHASAVSHREFDVKMLESLTKDSADPSPRETDVSRCIVHDDNGGNPKVMVITSPDAPGWRRYDDTIDYYDASGGGMRPHVKKLPRSSGIYPWNGTVIRFRPPKRPFLKKELGLGSLGKHFDRLGPIRMEAGSFNQLVGYWDRKLDPLAKGEFLQHLLEDWRPTVPFNVIAVILWSGVFPDPVAFINDLRPMIYTYWS
jgi:hypothetical protein